MMTKELEIHEEESLTVLENRILDYLCFSHTDHDCARDEQMLCCSHFIFTALEILIRTEERIYPVVKNTFR